MRRLCSRLSHRSSSAFADGMERCRRRRDPTSARRWPMRTSLESWGASACSPLRAGQLRTRRTPAYQALKLYRNYDGAHHTFAPISVSATNDATDPGLFSSYAAINAAGTTLTVLVINKSPSATVSTAINLNHFTAATATTYTLSSASPTSIVAGTSGAFQGTYSFAPYSATLLVISGTMAQAPAVEWDLNPDTIMVPARGSVTLSPKIVSGTGTVTLNSQQVGRRHYRRTHPTQCDRHAERHGDGDRGRNTRLLSLHRNRHGQHRHAADAGRMDRRRQSGGDADEDWEMHRPVLRSR